MTQKIYPSICKRLTSFTRELPAYKKVYSVSRFIRPACLYDSLQAAFRRSSVISDAVYQFTESWIALATYYQRVAMRGPYKTPGPMWAVDETKSSGLPVAAESTVELYRCVEAVVAGSGEVYLSRQTGLICLQHLQVADHPRAKPRTGEVSCTFGRAG